MYGTERCDRWFTRLCWLQGIYYGVTGVWPLVSIRSFILVTGEKTDHLPTGKEADHWLVITVSVLITSVALTLLVAAFRKTHASEIGILAVSASIALVAIDIIYTIRQVISPIYLIDAAVQLPLILAWFVVLAVCYGNCQPPSR